MVGVMMKLINLCLVVVGIMLTTISCSSRKMQKSKMKEESAVKERESLKLDSSSAATKTIGTVNTNTTDKYAFTDNLLIEYDPTFDTSGNLIPFRYTKTENGKTTDVNITGNGKVKSSINQQTDKTYTKEEYNYQEQINALVKTNKDLEKTVDSLVQKETKDVVSAPDYMKYILWLAIAGGLLTAIIIGVVIYFKATIGKYKTILNTFTNNDT